MRQGFVGHGAARRDELQDHNNQGYELAGRAEEHHHAVNEQSEDRCNEAEEEEGKPRMRHLESEPEFHCREHEYCLGDTDQSERQPAS